MRFYRRAFLRINLKIGKTETFEPSPILIDGLRISFNITKFKAWSTNSASIKIWNLSAKNRNLLKHYGDEVTLFAGYEQPGSNGAPQVIFSGYSNSVSHSFDQPEIVTTLECAEGELSSNQTSGRINVAYGANIPARTVLTSIAAEMKLPIVEFADSENLVYRNGYRFSGMGKDALDSVSRYLGLQSTNQKNVLHIIPINAKVNSIQIPVNQMTGMIGIPERFTYRRLQQYASSSAPTEGYRVNVLLNPSIIPGNTINLQSSHIDFSGPYSVEIVRHSGDTHGFDWITNLETLVLPGVNPKI